MTSYFNMEKPQFVSSMVNGNVGYFIVSNDEESVVFFEYVRPNEKPVLRCICSVDEMEDRLEMWNFRG